MTGIADTPVQSLRGVPQGPAPAPGTCTSQRLGEPAKDALLSIRSQMEDSPMAEVMCTSPFGCVQNEPAGIHIGVASGSSLWIRPSITTARYVTL